MKNCNCGFVKRMIEEHAKLVVRINKLNAWVYGEAYQKVDPVEYANEAIQLAAMKKYEEALRARLQNQGITFENGEYFEHIGSIKEEPEQEQEPEKGNE